MVDRVLEQLRKLTDSLEGAEKGIIEWQHQDRLEIQRLEEVLQIVVNGLHNPCIIVSGEGRVLFESCRQAGIAEVDEILEAVNSGQRHYRRYRMEVDSGGNGRVIKVTPKI